MATEFTEFILWDKKEELYIPERRLKQQEKMAGFGESEGSPRRERSGRPGEDEEVRTADSFQPGWEEPRTRSLPGLLWVGCFRESPIFPFANSFS